jgi:diacylglycerol kinase
MNLVQPDWKEFKYTKKFSHAFRGIFLMLKTTNHSFWHVLAALLTLSLGFYLHITRYEWMAICFAIGLVFISECFNTAIEIDMDLTSPEYHPYAKDTKDVAAGAVLLASFLAVVIGLLVFLPYF